MLHSCAYTWLQLNILVDAAFDVEKKLEGWNSDLSCEAALLLVKYRYLPVNQYHMVTITVSVNYSFFAWITVNRITHHYFTIIADCVQLQPPSSLNHRLQISASQVDCRLSSNASVPTRLPQCLRSWPASRNGIRDTKHFVYRRISLFTPRTLHSIPIGAICKRIFRSQRSSSSNTI